MLTLHRADIFEVDPASGKLTVKNSELLDREKQAVYYLTLQATDGGNLSSSTMLHVYLLDINDNVPVVSGSYNIFVQEEEGNVSVTIQVRASLDLVGRVGQGPKPGPVVVLALRWNLGSAVWPIQSLWASVSSLENEGNRTIYFPGHWGVMRYWMLSAQHKA